MKHRHQRRTRCTRLHSRQRAVGVDRAQCVGDRNVHRQPEVLRTRRSRISGSLGTILPAQIAARRSAGTLVHLHRSPARACGTEQERRAAPRYHGAGCKAADERRPGEVMAAVRTAMLTALSHTVLRDAVIAHLTITEGLGPLLAPRERGMSSHWTAVK